MCELNLKEYYESKCFQYDVRIGILVIFDMKILVGEKNFSVVKIISADIHVESYCKGSKKEKFV